jgi:hypothetical protein
VAGRSTRSLAITKVRFFLSGEIDAEIAEAFRATSAEVESKLNSALGNSSYGEAVEEIGIIPIVLSSRFRGRKERRIVQRRTRSADYRLFIEFDVFLHGSNSDRRRLLIENIVTSVADIHRKLKFDFDGPRLINDIRQLFAEDVT